MDENERLDGVAATMAGGSPSFPSAAPISPARAQLVTDEDTVLLHDLSREFSDADGDTISYEIVGDPTDGTAEIVSGGRVRFSPGPDFAGTDGFIVRGTDPVGGSTETVYVVSVAQVDDPPVAPNLEASGTEDQPLGILVASEVIDPDARRLTITVDEAPRNGTTRVNGDGSVTYAPNPDFNGTDSFGYTATDDSGQSDSGRVTVRIAPDNDPPVAVDDVGSVREDGTFKTNVLRNDSDPDGDRLTLTSATLLRPEIGTVEFNERGNIVFTPNPDVNSDAIGGPARIQYSIDDGSGVGGRTGTLDVTIESVNDNPSIDGAAIDATEDTRTIVDIASLVSDPDDRLADLTPTITRGPKRGDASIDSNGNLVIDWDADFNGRDQVQLQVTDPSGGKASSTLVFNVAPVNDLPVANDDAGRTKEDSTFKTNVLRNDVDADKDRLTLVSAELLRGDIGTIDFDERGNITFVPNPDVNSDAIGGPARIRYSIDDGSGTPGRTGTLDVDIESVNDGPRIDGLSIAATEDTPTIIALSRLVSDPDDPLSSLTAEITKQPRHGDAVLRSDGNIEILWDPNFNGRDGLVVQVSDPAGARSTAKFDIDVASVNDSITSPSQVSLLGGEDRPLVHELTRDFSDGDGDPLSFRVSGAPSNGTAEVSGNRVTYRPNPDFNGTDGFIIEGSDGDATSRSTYTVRIEAANDAPVANSFSVEGAEDQQLRIAALSQVTNPETEALSFEIARAPKNGDAVANGDGSITFQPNPDFSGKTALTYRVTDSQGASDTARIDITVNEVNDDPIVTDDEAVSRNGRPVSIDVLRNDTDADGDRLEISGVTQPPGASVEIDGNKLVFTPGGPGDGEARFAYQISDGQGGSGSGFVTVSIVDNEPSAPTDLPDDIFVG